MSRRSVVTEPIHKPVLLKEAVDFLNVKVNGFYVDATLGQAGHTREVARRGGLVLGIEENPETRNWLKQNFRDQRVVVVEGNFADLKRISQSRGWIKVKGILFDLGLSTFELKSSGRGFSYLVNEPLDLRLSPGSDRPTAADLVNLASYEELYEIFTKFGEIRNARRLCRALVGARSLKKVKTTFDLVSLVETAFPPTTKGKSISRKSKQRLLAQVFQALRIKVNQELINLEKALPQAIDLLEPAGRLVVISFESLEDRIVKRHFMAWQEEGRGRVLTASPVVPSRSEASENPAARSAKLRAFEKAI